MDTLVTVTGECFNAEFERKEVAQDCDGVYYLFRLKDMSEKARNDLLISLFRFGPDKLLTPDYESRIEAIRLNAIRRAFDAGAVSFDRPNEPHRYQMLSLTVDDFKARPRASDYQIRQYIVQKAYWLGYRLGSVANKLMLQFDVEFDLDYLGVASGDIRRNVWLLAERGFLRKTEFPGVSVPTAKLIQEYESKGGKTFSFDPEEAVPPSSVRLDDLLGIPLRGQMEQDLVKFGSASKGSSPLSVLWVDLDQFKPINDTYGHAMGDTVLKKIASAIESICHGKGQLYRYGGDELIIVLPNHNILEATATAERIRGVVFQASFADCPAKVTASIGVASCPESTLELNLLLAHADEAMYAAKHAGGNCVRRVGTFDLAAGNRTDSGER